MSKTTRYKVTEKYWDHKAGLYKTADMVTDITMLTIDVNRLSLRNNVLNKQIIRLNKELKAYKKIEADNDRRRGNSLR